MWRLTQAGTGVTGILTRSPQAAADSQLPERRAQASLRAMALHVTLGCSPLTALSFHLGTEDTRHHLEFQTLPESALPRLMRIWARCVGAIVLGSLISPVFTDG